jgi:hypothetical protein
VVTVRGGGPAPRQFYTKRLAADTALIPTLMAAGVEFGVLRQGMTSALVRCAATQEGSQLQPCCICVCCQKASIACHPLASHLPQQFVPAAADS